jgi:hypothetical protein
VRFERYEDKALFEDLQHAEGVPDDYSEANTLHPRYA